MHIPCLHDFFDWLLSQSLEQMVKNGKQLQNDYTEYLHIYCSVPENGVNPPFIFHIWRYILYFWIPNRKGLSNPISCIGTLLIYLGLEIQRGCRTNRDVKVWSQIFFLPHPVTYWPWLRIDLISANLRKPAVALVASKDLFHTSKWLNCKDILLTLPFSSNDLGRYRHLHH